MDQGGLNSERGQAVGRGPIFLAPESVNSHELPTEVGEETESVAVVQEVLSEIKGLIKEWDRVVAAMEWSYTPGPWVPGF